jgi:hypothetical protein
MCKLILTKTIFRSLNVYEIEVILPSPLTEDFFDPQKCGCTPKNEGKRIHVPPDEKTCGHAGTRCSMNKM